MTTHNDDIILRVENLYKLYKKREVVKNISIKVTRGEIVCLLGPNGAGKTTTFYMIVGLEKADHGKIYLNDIEISKLPMYKRALVGISYLAQESSIFRKLTVEENIKAILELKDFKSKTQFNKKLEELLGFLKIKNIRKEYGFSLSGGEKRRVEIARALATDPQILLLDEPFAGIDPVTINEIQAIIRELTSNFNISCLITDHNVRETLKISDYSYIIANGEIFKEGTPQELINSPEVRQIYLGDEFTL
jgi:lipopolysaccharide export system ATP-binding protein